MFHNPMTYVSLILAVALAIALFRLFKKDTTALEAFREDCLNASEAYSAEGFTVVPRILRDLALVKVRSFLKDAKQAIRNALRPGGAKEEADKLFANMLSKRLMDTTQVQAILPAVLKAAKVLSVVIPTV